MTVVFAGLMTGTKVLVTLTWNTAAKKQVKGTEDCFQNVWCPNYGQISFLELEIVGVCLSLSKPSRLEYQRYHVFQATRWPQDISKRQCSLSLGRFLIGFWLATISKISTFEAPKFSQSFSPFCSVLPAGLDRGAAAPEAKHRCTSQLRRATSWSSSGFSRPRRRWMRRTKMAVASDEDLGRKTSWGNGIVVRKRVECWWFKFFNTSLFLW